MAQFNISGNYITNGSKIIEHYNEYNFNWDKLEQEAGALKDKAATDTALTPAVSELQTAIKNKETNSVRQTIRQYAAEFSSATFANLASAGILALVKAFLS